MNGRQRVMFVVALAFALSIVVALVSPAAFGESIASDAVKAAGLSIGGVLLWAVISFLILETPDSEVGIGDRLTLLEARVDDLEDDEPDR